MNTTEQQRLSVLAIQAEKVRVAAVLDGLIDMILTAKSEFYSAELVDAWGACGDDAWGDRRHAFSIVQRHLRQREDEGTLQGRFQPQESGQGIGRRYYSWGSSGPSRPS